MRNNVVRVLTDEEKSFLLGKGYFTEENVEAFPESDFYQLTEHRYIPVVVAHDWLNFREHKTGNLITDYLWWLNYAKSNVGQRDYDIDIIHDEELTYENVKGYVEHCRAKEWKDYNLPLETESRSFVAKMYLTYEEA